MTLEEAEKVLQQSQPWVTAEPRPATVNEVNRAVGKALARWHYPEG